MTSFFNKGKFEQEIQGALVTWPRPAAKTNETKRETPNVQAQTQTRKTIDDRWKNENQNEANKFGNYRPPFVVDGTTPPEYADFDVNGTARAPVNAQPTVAPAAAPTAPTSSGQAVGPASIEASNSQLVGVPNITISLNNGKVQRIFSQSDIDYLKATGQISSSQADRAATQLQSRQSSNTSPVSLQKPQLQSKDY